MSNQRNGWGHRRWWFVIVVLFGMQLGLLFLISEKVLPAKPAPKKTAVLMLTKRFSENETFSNLLIPNPTVFVTANARGFSGEAWLNMPPQDYSIPDWDEPSRLLEINADRLGEVFTNFLRGTPETEVQIADKISTDLISFEEGTNRLAVSRFMFEGDIAKRPLLSIPELPIWPYTDVLRSTVVQLSVNGSGEVVFARLLSRCGLSTADQRAITIARELQFKPVNGSNAARNLMEGKIIFQWETVAAPTNTVSEFE